MSRGVGNKDLIYSQCHGLGWGIGGWMPRCPLHFPPAWRGCSSSRAHHLSYLKGSAGALGRIVRGFRFVLAIWACACCCIGACALAGFSPWPKGHGLLRVGAARSIGSALGGCSRLVLVFYARLGHGPGVLAGAPMTELDIPSLINLV